MSTPRARTALRRNILIAACAVGLVVVIGLVAERRDATRTPPAEQQAKLAAVQQHRVPEGATEGSSAYPSPPPAPEADSPAATPVVIAVVKPWVEIARMPQYVQASSAEREAMRGMYWRICVEARIPSAHRASAYWQFVRDSEITESGASETRTRKTSSFLRERQAAAPSPVNAETMRRSCAS